MSIKYYNFDAEYIVQNVESLFLCLNIINSNCKRLDHKLSNFIYIE